MNNEAFLLGFVKAAYEGASRVELNSFAPVARRQLDGSEHQQISEAKKKILPKIFTSMADPLTADMSSPAWAGGITGGMGAGLGGLIGAGLGGEQHPILGALLGATAGGGIGGLFGYKGREATNASIEEAMRKLPSGSTRDDYERDPRVQAEREQAIKMLLATGRSQNMPYWRV